MNQQHSNWKTHAVFQTLWVDTDTSFLLQNMNMNHKKCINIQNQASFQLNFIIYSSNGCSTITDRILSYILINKSTKWSLSSILYVNIFLHFQHFVTEINHVYTAIKLSPYINPDNGLSGTKFVISMYGQWRHFDCWTSNQTILLWKNIQINDWIQVYK